MATRLQIAVIAILCATSSVAADYSISVATTQERIFGNPAVLGAECGTTKRIYACTVFAEEHLTCSCEQRGGSWHLVATARFVPIMLFYLHHPDIVQHEQSHIDDVVASLDQYLGELTSCEFNSKDECTRDAKSDEVEFVQVMNGFRRASAAKRDRF